MKYLNDDGKPIDYIDLYRILSNPQVVAAQIEVAEAINSGKSSFEGFAKLTKVINQLTSGQRVAKATDEHIKAAISDRDANEIEYMRSKFDKEPKDLEN